MFFVPMVEEIVRSEYGRISSICVMLSLASATRFREDATLSTVVVVGSLPDTSMAL